MRRASAFVLLMACGQAETTPCQKACSELYTQCDYQAFPSYQSCEQGCLYWEEQGANVAAYLECLDEAACNTFATLECEHDFGPSAE